LKLQVAPVLKGKALGHEDWVVQMQLVDELDKQHFLPAASACWTNNNSIAEKATTAKLNTENNFVNDRLLGNRYNSFFILCSLFLARVSYTELVV
jgi:hypothetical protein